MVADGGKAMGIRPATTPGTGLPVRVIVADDHVALRSGVSAILESELGASVVATARTGPEVAEAALAHAADLVVLDLDMPGGGLATIEDLRTLRPALKVLVYSMHAGREWALRCMSAGAAGYLSKEADLDELMNAVRAVVAGRRYVAADVAEDLISRAISPADADGPPHLRLSNREYEVFELLSRGRGTAEVAATLGLSPKTVSTHRSQIFRKLGVRRTGEVIRYAIRHGIVEA